MSSIEHSEKVDAIFKRGRLVMIVWLVDIFLQRTDQYSRTTSVIKRVKQEQSAS